jgi:hypothetical protein
MATSTPTILGLKPAHDQEGDDGLSLRDQIVNGLRGRSSLVVPGQTPEDRLYAYTKTVPTS